MNVFQKARIKLTLMYLSIIMLISLSFSAFIYQSVARQFKHHLQTIEKRYIIQRQNVIIPRGEMLLLNELVEVRREVMIILIYMNGVIFIFSATAGYFLAGKTLQPIEQAMKDQKRFVADASHELKTPLTSLKTSIEVALRDKKINLKEAKDLLSDNLIEIDKLKSLANYLLTLTKVQEQKLTLEKINIKESLEKIIKDLKPIAEEKNIKIKTKLKKVYVMADKDSIEKLTSILIDNAIKYTQSGGQINIKLTQNNKYAEVSIADNGIGIDPVDKKHIFERFYRSDKSRSKISAEGFGLGLSIAKQIVEQHKGDIRVESKLGKGSKFIFKLPRA